MCHFLLQSEQKAAAKKVVSLSELEVGDILWRSGHVGIYIGNNQVVHAGSTATGIHTSTANYRSVNCVRRIVK